MRDAEEFPGEVDVDQWLLDAHRRLVADLRARLDIEGGLQDILRRESTTPQSSSVVDHVE